MNLTQSQKQRLTALHPELREFLEQRETNQLLSGLFSQIKLMKGDKGDKGDTPIRGKDYLTDAELNSIIRFIKDNVVTPELIKKITPRNGVDGLDYVLTPTDKEEIASKVKVPIVEKVIERTEVIKEVSRTMDVSSVKGAVSKKDLEIQEKKILDGMARIDGRLKLVDQRWHGAGLSRVSTDGTLTGNGTPSSPLSVVSSGGSFTVLPTPSTINDSNVSFTFTSLPTLICINGAFYQQTGGAITWSWNAGTLTATLSAPVGQGGNIFGIK